MEYIQQPLLLEMQTVESGRYNNGHNRWFCEQTPHVREGGMTPLNASSVRLMKLPPSRQAIPDCYAYIIHYGLRE